MRPGASLQGMNLAKEIRDQERGGRTYVGVVDGEDEKASPQELSCRCLGLFVTLLLC